MGYNLFRGLTTYLYWGYNLATKYHGHPSRIYLDPHGFKTLAGFANEPTEVDSLFARRKDFSEPVAETDVVETKVEGVECEATGGPSNEKSWLNKSLKTKG